MKILMDAAQIDRVLERMAFQLVENHAPFQDTVIIGIQPRGIGFSDRLVQRVQRWQPDSPLTYGKLDITFYRDDVRKELHTANETDIRFSIEKKNVILVDDVLYTGRTIRAALDALLDFGRPRRVELCVLIDRRFSRELPIQPDYCGQAIDTIMSQRVVVQWDSPAQVLLTEKP